MVGPDLSNLPIFAKLTPECRQQLSGCLITRDITAGQTIVLEGGQAEACYFIRSGIFRVLRTNHEGKIQVLARLNPGEPINLISLLLPERINHASVEALNPASVLALTAQDFDVLLVSCPEFSTSLLKHFAQRISQMTDLAASLSLLPVRVRLARFLIELANRTEKSGEWTQDEIAAQIGTVRDMVGRVLRDFEEQGLIVRDRQQITLLNKAGLMQEADLD